MYISTYTQIRGSGSSVVGIFLDLFGFFWFFEHNSATLGRTRTKLGQIKLTGLPELSKHHISLTNSQEEDKHQFQNVRQINKS